MKNSVEIANNFGKREGSYTLYADIQKHVAENLARILPELKAPKILEVGCGTGFLTKTLFQKYPDASFDITDLSFEMLASCKKNNPHKRACYFVMDGENPICDAHYDLIVSSMTFQWFQDPIKTLRKLSSKGNVYFSALGKENFKEWKNFLITHNIEDKTLPIAFWPCILEEEIIKKDYKNGLNFLRTLKLTGANSSFSTAKKYDYRSFKKVLSAFDGRVRWHIVYGCQPFDDTTIGAR